MAASWVQQAVSPVSDSSPFSLRQSLKPSRRLYSDRPDLSLPPPPIPFPCPSNTHAARYKEGAETGYDAYCQIQLLAHRLDTAPPIYNLNLQSSNIIPGSWRKWLSNRLRAPHSSRVPIFLTPLPCPPTHPHT